MNKYLESIKSMDYAGTGVQEQIIPESTPILEMSGDALQQPMLSRQLLVKRLVKILYHIQHRKKRLCGNTD